MIPTGFDVNMLQKCTILSLVFLLAGGAAFGWLYRQAQEEQRQLQGGEPATALSSQDYIEKYGRWYQLSPEQQNQLVLEIDAERKSKTAEQLGREQQARLNADLDKLAARQMNPGDIADFLYGKGWQDQVEQYKTRNEQRETAQTISMVCLSLGGALFGVCAILGLIRLVVWVIRSRRNRSSDEEVPTEPETPELTDLELHEPPPQEAAAAETPASQEQPKQRRKLLTLSETTNESGAEPSAGLEDLFSRVAQSTGASYPSPARQSTGEDAGVAVLLTDEQGSGNEWSPQSQWSLHTITGIPSATRPTERKNGSAVESTLKEQADHLQQQIAEFKQVAQDVQQVTREQSEPLSNTLKELTQQVSAIREYAASQQGRVEKLQDGYDWGIIRTFCLRVIRCVDNLEGRLAELSEDDGAVRHLEEVKDELLFALESSGVEQFRPEINSDFQGQEKLAEALRDKQPAKKPEQAGRIAKVIRPGYRYMIDDENYRVVRTAQVKLYG